VRERPDANFDGKHASVLAAVRCLETLHVACIDARAIAPRQRRIAIEVGVHVAQRLADQLVASVAEALAGHPVDVDDVTGLVVDEQGVGGRVEVRPNCCVVWTAVVLGSMHCVAEARLELRCSTKSRPNRYGFPHDSAPGSRSFANLILH
jgi:hypothetical protein